MTHQHDHRGHDHGSHAHDHSAGGGHSHARGHGHAHGHGHGHGHAEDADRRRVLIAACLTGGFMAAEAIAGWLTGSLALVADAGHMLTDTVSLVLAWYAFRLAGRKATSSMTYGFHRVKTVVAYTNGITIFAVALWICYEAVTRVMEPTQVLAGPMLWVAVAGLGVNVAAFLVLHGGSRESLNMRGAVLHVLGDMLGSVAAIAAAVIILLTGWTPADPILSVLVALLICSTAWKLTRDAAHVLLEGVPSGLDRDGIAGDIVAHVATVREIHHMHLWSLDGTKIMATLHASLIEGADAGASVRAIKARLATRHGIDHVTVEPECGACADQPQQHLN